MRRAAVAVCKCNLMLVATVLIWSDVLLSLDGGLDRSIQTLYKNERQEAARRMHAATRFAQPSNSNAAQRSRVQNKIDDLSSSVATASAQDDIGRVTTLNTPVFQPKATEAPSDDDYIGNDPDMEYYDYESPSDYPLAYDAAPKKPDGGGGERRITSTTSSPKWITKNTTAPSKFNLNSIFDFVEYILRPTSPTENTIELTNRHKMLDTEDTHIDPIDYIFSPNAGPTDHDHSHSTSAALESRTTTTTSRSLVVPSAALSPSSSLSFLTSKNDSQAWFTKENVCQSKMAFQRDSKTSSSPEYWYINGCKSKFDSDFCVTNIQAGQRSFEIRSTVFCCPKHRLNPTHDACMPYEYTLNLYSELQKNLYELNRTMARHLLSIDNSVQNGTSTSTTATIISASAANDSSRQERASLVASFMEQLASIYDEVTNDAHNTVNSTKYTVYLWDNRRMIDYATSILSFHDYEIKIKLDKIIAALRNHIVKQHHITQSIVSNTGELTSLAGKQLRLSTFNLENRSVEFVNCREIRTPNQYYKSVSESEHHYRLLIHKLQPGSLLVPSTKSVYQVLCEKFLKTPSSADKSSNNNNVNSFKIYAQIFAQAGNDKLARELHNSPQPLSVFVPTDAAFRASLRADQIEALASDPACAYKLVKHNIVNEEICPSQLVKYNAEYSSYAQRANFLAVSENATSMLYFNGQLVNVATKTSAINGVVYKLDSLKVSGVVEFLYDLVASFKKKFAADFVAALQPNWLELVRNASPNTTLFMPFEDRQHALIDNRTIAIEHNSSSTTSTPSTSTTTTTTTTTTVSATTPIVALSGLASSLNNSRTRGSTINIADYMVQPRYSYYELNNGDVLTSISRPPRAYLVSVFAFESSVPDFMAFVPQRNFQRKAINCQQLEMPDLSACSSQLIVFRSASNHLAPLDTSSLLDFVRRDNELTGFNAMIARCGSECIALLDSLLLKTQTTTHKHRGYTLFVPTDSFFKRMSAGVAERYAASNSSVLRRLLAANVFHGTNCLFYLRMDVLVENMLGRRVRSRKLYERVIKAHAFLSASGILVHKTESL